MNILYICTHNRCRSILSEAITNHFAQPWITAQSAGSQPQGEVHPLTLRYLQKAGIATLGLHSKSWEQLDNFTPDVVITVCDSAAGEACPLWLGNTLKIHWGLKDPSKLQGSDEVLEEAFKQCIATIKTRVHALTAIAQQERSHWPALLTQLIEHQGHE